MSNVSIKPIQEKTIWESCLLALPSPPFLQSWAAGEQSVALGDSILRLGIYENELLVGVALVIQTRAKRGDYLYVPYGPILQSWSKEYLQALTTYLVKWGREHKFDFIRFSPFISHTQEHQQLFQLAGYKTSPIHALAEVIWTLNLEKDEDQLLLAMRKTTRNLIRRAKKDGVQVHQSTSNEDLNNFITLLEVTRKRHDFIRYSDRMLKAQVDAFTADDQTLIFSGYHQNELLASSIIMYYGDMASYHHGGSIRSKVPVAYRLQWEAILEAKRRGCKTYNFWGILEKEDKSHPFNGITLFKKGFGGEIRYLMPAQDYPITKHYWFSYCIESIRRIKRGFGWKRHIPPITPSN